MIPVRLQLHNFMSYGEGVPPLELADVRLACLSGDNGNGKSAILDAMTWALFGETRAKTEDDVIRIGAKSAGVIFEFAVGPSRYRIERRRDRGNRGALWEFQVRQDDGAFRSLSGATTRETKEKIQSVLRMDYKTFLSTSYLRQGEADAFARSTAGERKDVLAKILDLSRYDALESLAREKLREATAGEADADRALTEIDAELEGEDAAISELAAAEARRTDCLAAIESARIAHDEAAAACAVLEESERRAAKLADDLRDADESLARDRYDEAESERKIVDAERTVARKPEILTALDRRADLDARLGPLEARWSGGLALQAEARRLDASIRDARSGLERRRDAAEREIAERHRDAAATAEIDGNLDTLAADLKSLDDQLASLGDAEAAHRAAEAAVQKADESVAALRAEHAARQTERSRLDARIQALAQSDSPLCDWCGQPLPPLARKKSLAASREELRDIDAALTALLETGRDAKRIADAARAESAAALRESRRAAALESQRPALLAQSQSLERRRGQIPERSHELPGLEKTLESVVASLEQNRFALEERDALASLNAELDALDDVGKQVTRLRKELDTLRDLERDVERLRVAEETTIAEPPRLEAVRSAISKRVGQIQRARTLLAELELKTRDLAEYRRRSEAARLETDESHRALQRAERLVGQLTAERARLEKRKVERLGWQARREEALRNKDVYRELAAAFGKRGVQALIIENALPEIEEEANRLLGRMTQGAMKVRFKMTRDAKTKGASAIETLDIELSDDAGTRPYELYSGGEAFRVNLALRVALSRTLARRAGAPLQTLLLDEGFGTQDPRGREAIAEALHSVAEDFAMVLVITHIDDLKESFPTRIEVTKTESGSTFTVQ